MLLPRIGFGLVCAAMLLWSVPRSNDLRADEKNAVTDIESRLELFVDRHLIESTDGVRLVLHSPEPREQVLQFNEPWEGPASAYVTVFRDGERFRMYYRGWPNVNESDQTCYAESRDGIHWTKPRLGMFEFQGSKDNNIVWQGIGTHNFAPFLDARPGVPAEERYKAVGRSVKPPALFAFTSPDGLRWKQQGDQPIITQGAFDSQNLAFWDPNKQRYVSYYRVFINRVRAIALAESEDFVHWSTGQPIDVGSGPAEHFYTNATAPYFRAPHYYFAFPKRFASTRKRLPDYDKVGISEAVFMSSRDGLHFDRTFREALIRPGRDHRNWVDRTTMVAWGLVQTAEDEMSIYYSQHYHFDTHHLRRGVFRLDGIASAQAGFEGGELITRPIRFAGKQLILNYATSASGSVRIEIQDAGGQPIPGFTLADAPELYGDEIAEAYKWKSGSDVSSLAGKPIRLRFVLADGDLYSYKFE